MGSCRTILLLLQKLDEDVHDNLAEPKIQTLEQCTFGLINWLVMQLRLYKTTEKLLKKLICLLGGHYVVNH